jgi:hypothetical protein
VLLSVGRDEASLALDDDAVGENVVGGVLANLDRLLEGDDILLEREPDSLRF